MRKKQFTKLICFLEIIRKPTEDEIRILDYLIKKSNLNLSIDWKSDLKVKSMDDGGMGSLYLYLTVNIIEKSLFSHTASTYEFDDLDGIKVFASLNVNDHDDIFELDIWKTDFSPLIKMPSIL